MNVIPLLVFVSLLLVVAALLLFAHGVRHGDHEHADRLALLPLEHERTAGGDTPPRSTEATGEVDAADAEDRTAARQEERHR